MSANGASTLRYAQGPFGEASITTGFLTGRLTDITAFVSGMVTEYRVRRELRRLLRKDDWLLNDIGLSRKALAYALRQPLHVSACDQLKKRRERFGQQ